MSNIAKFAVTTPEGRKQAFDLIDKYGWEYGWVLAPLWFYWKAGNFLVDAVQSLTSGAVTKEIELQTKAATEIIRVAKENDVDELEITMSEKAGLSLGANVEGFPIELIAGSSGNMKLKVKYKG
ncbi:hypothetical protein [Pseudanabaena sp. PCC 6802]|uniref:hypothetical protein n=1 Tax=Pseudanabaena sp. PCC 6802 TaxID=118173 RepID=UPI00034A1D06|nr:hypothetical protein [Pseudanabaena sp. PCC 6802]